MPLAVLAHAHEILYIGPTLRVGWGCRPAPSPGPVIRRGSNMAIWEFGGRLHATRPLSTRYNISVSVSGRCDRYEDYLSIYDYVCHLVCAGLYNPDHFHLSCLLLHPWGVFPMLIETHRFVWWESVFFFLLFAFFKTLLQSLYILVLSSMPSEWLVIFPSFSF